MTEQQNLPAVDEEIRETPETPRSQPKSSSGRAGLVLSILAIATALAAGAGLYTWGKQQDFAQSATTEALTSQLAALKKAQEMQQASLEKIIQQQASQLTQAEQQQAALARQLDEVKQKVNAIAGSDAKTWLLAQADFLVKLAGRKLWSDEDVTTAAALLKSADLSLADMNDSSLIGARRAITQDIATLSTVSQVDYDGIILKVNQLANQIDNLRLADNNDDNAPMDDDGSELSTSLKEWRVNLVKSWHNFMDSFITIRRRDDTAVPLLAPNQDIYLRENIRSRLLVAAQAVPRHQDEIFKQALDNVSTWVRAYYDTDDSATKAFLEELDALSQQSIHMDIPQSLQSQPVLEKLMQSRVRNLLAQPQSDAAADTPAAPAQGE